MLSPPREKSLLEQPLKKKYQKNPISLKCLTFSASHLFLYAMYRLFLTQSGVGWEYEKKTSSVEFSDVSYVLMISILLHTFGNYENTSTKVTYVCMPIGLIGFGLLQQVPFLKNSLASSGTWPWQSWLVYSVGLSLVVLLFAIHIYFAVLLQNDFWKLYIMYMFICISYIVLAYFVTYNDTAKQSFHIHHWFLFLCISLFTRFDHWISALSAGLCIGIYLSGMITYSVTFSIFEPKCQ